MCRIDLGCDIFHEFLISRGSGDFPSDQFTESKCKTKVSQSPRTYNIELREKHKSTSLICDASSLFGHIMLHNRNDFSSSLFINIRRSRKKTFLLRPKIVTTDESLRNVRPEM